MKEKHIGGVESKEVFYEELEGFARGKIREHLQSGLGKEKAALLVVIGVQKNGSKRFLGLEPGLSREQGVVGRSSPPAQNPRSEKCPAFRWRWEFGVIGGGWRSVSPDRAAAVLESQDAQRDGCRKQEGTNRGQKAP